MTEFTHLHTHSHFSLLEALPTIPELVKQASELGFTSLALTDYGNLYGALEFYQKARAAGVKPIIGMEAFIADDMKQKRAKIDARPSRIILLAENNEGYRNLLKITTAGHLEGFYYRPRIDKNFLRGRSKGLIALSGSLKGDIPQAIINKDIEKAEKLAREYEEIFGKGNFFFELASHPELPWQDAVNGALSDLAKKLEIDIAAANDVHYLKPEDAEACDLLLCVKLGRTVEDPARQTLRGHNFSLRSGQEMAKAFEDRPGAIENTQKIAERCNLELELNQWHFPKIDLEIGKTEDKALREKAYAGIEKLIPKADEKIKERLGYELKVICDKKYPGYFLVVADFVNWAKSQNISVTTRGSAAGSLVSYCLGITTVNPLDFKLPFERFLNPLRPSAPDIDIDIADDKRDAVIEYVIKKYGQDHAAQICTFGTMLARASVRDVGRALGYPYPFCDIIAKMIPFGKQGFTVTIESAMEQNPDLERRYKEESQVRRLIDLAKKIEGRARHCSIHAAGVVISPEPLTNFIPLQRETREEKIITQFEMYSCETAGLVKMDFLGIRNLSILDLAATIVKFTKNKKIDLNNIPLNDEKTFKLLAEGHTMGLFQLGGSGMTRYLKDLKPSSIYDIQAIVALYRPGPIESIPEFIRRKHNPHLINYPDPRLEEYLKQSYGLLVYQDDVLYTAIQLAGYDWLEADKLRKAMGKKIKEAMAAEKNKFISGCIEYGKLSHEKAGELWGLIEPFAAYGFNRCLVGGTQIQDPKTGKLHTIEELYKKQKANVISLDKTIWKLAERSASHIKQNGKKSIFNLVTRTGRTICATANHPFRVFTGWKRLEDLSPGDRIAVSRRLPHGQGAKISDDALRALGYLISEGNLCHPHGIYFYSKNEGEIQDFIKCATTFKNTKATINRSKSVASVYVGKQNQKEPNELFEWLKGVGLLKKKAAEKFIPKIIEQCNRQQSGILIGKLWQGDGCINIKRQDGQIFYATSSGKLVRQIQHFLLRFGVISTIHNKKFKYRGGIKFGYSLTISRYNNVERFAEAVKSELLHDKEKILEVILNKNKSYYAERAVLARGTKDIIPTEVFNLIRECMSKKNLSAKKISKKCGLAERLFYKERRRVGYQRETIDIIANALNDSKLKAVANSDIYWDEIVLIKPAGKEITYDLTVPDNHNFVANDIIVHNSHAASYAMVAYQTAYMKANYPSEFMAAVMTCESHNLDKVAEAVAECANMGIEVLAPDINESLNDFTYISDTQIRFGLRAIKNVGEDVIRLIKEERLRSGPYKSLTDFVGRVPAGALNRKAIESMVKAGAFDKLGERNQILENLDKILKFGREQKKIAETGQESLFGGSEGVEELRLTDAPPATTQEKLSWEKELLGFYLTSHPLEVFSEELKGKINDIQSIHGDLRGEAAIAGIVTRLRIINTKRNERMCFAQVEDQTGSCEVVIFPESFEKTKHLWLEDQILLIKGKISERDDEAKILCNAAAALEAGHADEALESLPQPDESDKLNSIKIPKGPPITIKTPEDVNPGMLAELKRILSLSPGDHPVFLVVNGRRMRTSIATNADPENIKRIERITGLESVKINMGPSANVLSS